MCRRGLLAALALLVVLAAGCRYPDDPEATLERITGGELIVGVTENPPWVVREADGSASGVEAALVGELARQLDSRIVWQWGTESQLLEALAAHQLDLAIGGFREGAPVKPVAGVSKFYHEATVRVGVPANTPLPASLEGMSVAVGPLQSHVDKLKRQGATVQRSERLADESGLVAAPDWWLEAHGFTAGKWQIGKERYVMAVPPGENGWLLRVQRHLDAQQEIAARAVAGERQRAGAPGATPGSKPGASPAAAAARHEAGE